MTLEYNRSLTVIEALKFVLKKGFMYKSVGDGTGFPN